MDATKARNALIEILAISSRTASTSDQATNPSDQERLAMIERIAKKEFLREALT
jgi:hypothetical protein